jgi:trigger factor
LETGQGLERRLQVRVPSQRIELEVEARLRSVGRTANIKGYRPGKVPEKVIRQRFGEQVRREVLQELIQSTYGEALSPFGNSSAASIFTGLFHSFGSIGAR